MVIPKIFKRIFIVMFLSTQFSAFSQAKDACEIVEADFKYYEIYIHTPETWSSFFHVVGPAIDFDKISKVDEENFINDILSVSYLTPVLEFGRRGYFKDCNLKIESEEEEMLLIYNLNLNLNSNSKKIQFSLKSNQGVVVTSIGLQGSFLKIDSDISPFHGFSEYPYDVNHSKLIKDYYIPLKIKKFYSID